MPHPNMPRYFSDGPLAGHNRAATTELVYRHELRPVITTGAEVMDQILSNAAMALSMRRCLVSALLAAVMLPT